MRAFVRVLVLLAGAAHLAACAVNEAAGESPGAAQSAARAEPALLSPQPSPQCELPKPPEGIPPEQARAATLDYEQQCYRQLAERAYARLNALQDAAEKARSFAAAHPALLERQPSPHCEPTKPAAGVSPAEAREARLDAERQCYKALEASNRQKLDALQDAFRKGAPAAHSRRGAVAPARREPNVPY